MSHSDQCTTQRSRPGGCECCAIERSPRWLLVFAMLMMLGQQVALAANACTMAAGAMEPMMAMSPMESMNAVPEIRGPSDHALCQKHCAPNTAA